MMRDGAVFELAHPLVDQIDQIDQPIGHRRIDGVAHGLRIDPLQADTVGVLVLGVETLGERNDFRENIEFFRHAGPAAEQHVDDFFEIEQPERQFQIARIQHQRIIAENSGHIHCARRAERCAGSGRAFRISLSSSDTPVDLPTPVDPSTAKCFESISSTLT